jgi:hypothetical protein
MSNGKTFNPPPKRNRVLERPEYQVDAYLSAPDLAAEQRYRLERLMHHNRYSHGAGVICGLQVLPAHIPAKPWAVRVCPGYALGCCGEEIEIRSAALLDIREYMWNRPSGFTRVAPPPYVAVRRSERAHAPQPASTVGCGCDDTRFEASRIRDGYELNVLWKIDDKSKPRFDPCAPGTPPCPHCIGKAYVLLARVTLPANESESLSSAQIENLSRRRIFTTAAAQRQLIECCCAAEAMSGRS